MAWHAGNREQSRKWEGFIPLGHAPTDTSSPCYPTYTHQWINSVLHTHDPVSHTHDQVAFSKPHLQTHEALG